MVVLDAHEPLRRLSVPDVHWNSVRCWSGFATLYLDFAAVDLDQGCTVQCAEFSRLKRLLNFSRIWKVLRGAVGSTKTLIY